MVKSIHAKQREGTGQSHNRKLREKQIVPAVVYGREVENKNLRVPATEIRSVLEEGGLSNVLVELDVDDEEDTRDVLIKDVDIHPVESNLRHVDFHQVSPTDDVQVKVPVELSGQSVGVEQEGGIIFQPVREITVSCQVQDIPSSIDLDISELDIGDVLFIRDIPTSDSVEIIEDSDRTVVSIQPPKEYDLEPTVPEVGAEVEETVEEALEEAAELEEEVEAEPADEEAEEAQTAEGSEEDFSEEI